MHRFSPCATVATKESTLAHQFHLEFTVYISIHFWHCMLMYNSIIIIIIIIIVCVLPEIKPKASTTESHT